MSKEELLSFFFKQKNIHKIEKEQLIPELIDEVIEGVEGFIILITVCDSFLLLILTITLLVTSPLLAPWGIIFIAHLSNHYCKKIQKLRNNFR